MTGRSTESVAGAVAIALHAAVIAALVSYQPTRAALLSAAPVMVNLLQPEARPEAPVQVPPKPRPVVKPVPKPEPLPLVAAPAEAPSASPIVVPPPPPSPSPPEPAPIVSPPPLVVTPPIYAAGYLDNPAPIYPAASRRIGEQGRVLLRVLVSPGGKAGEVEIRESSGHLRLDEAARETVRRWRFVPAKRGDEPVAAWVLIPISFRLER